jgi:hypothetical protein
MSDAGDVAVVSDPSLMGKLPDFICVGAQKCGTTSVIRNLQKHPDVHLAEFVHPGATTAETYYFWFPKYHRDLGVEWYKQQFRKDKVSGEKTPDYMISKATMALVGRTVPDAKIFVCLRCPVQRMISEFNMRRRRRGLKSVDEVFDDKLMYEDYIGRGFYAKQLKENVYAAYPREQVLVLIMDEYETELDRTRSVAQATHGRSAPDAERKQAPIMKQVYDFLGLTPLEDSLEYHFMGDYAGFPELTDSQLARLKETYRKPNEELFELLGRRISTWL